MTEIWPFRLMGVVNVTPDSFSDGGLFLDPGEAIVHGLGMVGEGAEILDVGGESTRPGAEPVAEAEELRRVLPVIEGLASANATRPSHPTHSSSSERTSHPAHPQISIDTAKASVARAALDAGATLVNDVTALRGDPGMAAVVAQSGAECCLMHMRGDPRTMQREPRYEDVVDEVGAFLEERLAFAVAEGIAEERVLLDPGIGFGKTLEHNLELLRRLGELAALGRPLVVGTSRKSFLGRILAGVSPVRGAAIAGGHAGGASSVEGHAGGASPAGGGAKGRTSAEPLDVRTERLPGTIATCVLAYERGASVLRVHDVAPVRAALAVAAATLGAR
jgi:dihydropteroate synthase